MSLFKFVLCLALFNASSQSFALGSQAAVEEAKFVEILNLFRAKLFLQPLQTNEKLFAAAEGHAEWMAHKRILTHAGPSLFGTCGTRIFAEGIDDETLVGENIARGSYDAKSTFIQWFFSSPHLQGMLTPEYTHIGVARRGCEEPALGEKSDSWSCFWVTDFADLSTEKQAGSQDRFYSDQALIQAAEDVVGELDAEDKADFENPTFE
jgi:hypothetical protein